MNDCEGCEGVNNPQLHPHPQKMVFKTTHFYPQPHFMKLHIRLRLRLRGFLKFSIRYISRLCVCVCVCVSPLLKWSAVVYDLPLTLLSLMARSLSPRDDCGVCV